MENIMDTTAQHRKVTFIDVGDANQQDVKRMIDMVANRTTIDVEKNKENGELVNKLHFMISALDNERRKAKLFLIEHDFDCTTSPFVLVEQYRDNLKQLIKMLRDEVKEIG